MSQEQKQISSSPFDCAVCGGCVYGNTLGIRTCLPCKSFFKRHALLPVDTLKCNQNGKCYIETTRRYFSAAFPPCRACRLQKCLSIGMDLNLLRPRSSSSPPLMLPDQFYHNGLIKASSDDNVVPSNRNFQQNLSTNMNNDEMLLDGRVRCLSDASDRQRQF